MNGERHGAVADLIDIAINGDQSDPEMRRISSLQLRDVVGDRARLVFFELGVRSRQELLQRWLSSISPKTSRRVLGDELN